MSIANREVDTFKFLRRILSQDLSIKMLKRLCRPKKRATKEVGNMNDKDHHKAMKSNALTLIYLMPTN